MLKPKYEVCKGINSSFTSYTDRAEDYFTELFKTYGREELQKGLQQNVQTYIDSTHPFYPVDVPGLTQEQLDILRNAVKPNSPAPSDEVKAERRQQQQQLSATLFDLYAKQVFLQYALKPEGGILDREYQVLYDFTDLSAAGLEESRQALAAFADNSTMSEEERKEQFLRQLDKINKIDLTVLDPMNMQSMLDHTADAVRAALVGVEMQKYMGRLRDYGPDIARDPRARQFIDRSNLLYELGGLIKTSLDCACSSLYPELGSLQKDTLQSFDFNREVQPLTPRTEEDEEEALTVYGEYVRGEQLSRLDASAQSWFKMISFTQPLQSPLADSDKPIVQRQEEFTRTNDHFKTKEFLARAVATDYSRESGHISMPDAASSKQLYTYIFGETNSAGYSVPMFHPALRGDVARIYSKGENGEYVPAFPQAKNDDFPGLKPEQITDILSSTDKKYVYFPAGSTEPHYMENGTWQSVQEKMQDNRIVREAITLPFGEDGRKRMAQDFTPEEKISFDNELRRHQLDCEFFDYQRVNEMEKTVYGSSATNEGSEQFRTYEQQMVHTMRTRVDPQSIMYPNSNGKLSEEDVSALTLLSVADPDVNGNKLPIDPLLSVSNGYGMVVTDMYIQRAHTPNSHYMDWSISGRQALKPRLEAYYKNGTPGDLAKTIAHGIHELSMNSTIVANFSPDTVSGYVPACWVSELLEKHPDLLEAARQQARQEGTLGLFEADLEKCNIQRAIRNLCIDAKQAERRLLDNKEGLLKNVDGKSGATLTATEVEQLQDTVDVVRFLDKAAHSYGNVIEISPDLPMKVMEEDQRVSNLPGISEDVRQWSRNAVQNLYLVSQNESPMPAVFSLVASKNKRGMESLKNVLHQVNNPENTNEVLSALYEKGLIPNRNGSADPLFDYEEATNAARVLSVRKPGDPLPAGATEDMTPAQINRLRYSNYQFEREDVSKETVAVAQEMGLTFKEMKEMSEQHHLTIEEYGQTLRDEYAAATEQTGLPKDLQADVQMFEMQPNQLKEKAMQEGQNYWLYIRKEIQQAKDILSELGMDVADVQELAQSAGMTTYEYIQNMQAANAQAEAQPVQDLSAAKPVEKTGLAKFEDILSAEKIGQLSPEQLCTTMKDLNRYAQENCRDPYRAYQSGELMQTLYKHIHTKEKTSPEMKKAKDLHLRREDFVQAQQTVKAGVDAAKKMKSGDLVQNVKHEEIFRQESMKKDHAILGGP